MSAENASLLPSILKNPGKPFLNVSNLLLLVFTVWLIFNLIQSVQYIIADYSGIPIQDYWRVAQLWPQYKAFHFAGLWQQHNEHRIIFPELTFIADMFLFRGRMYLPIALSGLCYLGVWCILVWAVYSSGVMVWPAREAALLLAGVIMAWKGCSSVIATPFQIQFTLLQLFSALALMALVKLSDNGRSRYLLLLISFAAIGTYCSGNGMLLWPVLVAGAVLLRLGKARVGIIALSAVLFTGAYFIGYRFQPSNLSVNLRHPLLEFAFLCSYMSMPFGSFGAASSGVIIGAVNMLLMLLCAVFAWRRKLLHSRPGIVVFGLYLFTFLSALLTMAGRLDLKDRTFWAAKAWRYMTMPTVAWSLLVIALIWLAAESTFRRRTLLLAAFMGVFFCWGFQRAARWMETTRVDFAYSQIVATMLRNNVFDAPTVMPIFSSPDFVRDELQFLKVEKKAIYARGPDKWIGQDVQKLYPQSVPLAGKITRVYPVPGGLEVLGWADNTWLNGDHPVLFVDQKTGKIAGYGKRPPAGFPVKMVGWDMPQELSFAGFIRVDYPAGRRFLVYSRTLHGKFLQPLDSVIEAPSFTQLQGNTAPAGLVPDIKWQAGDAWTPNGYKVEPENGKLPAGQIYGSGPEEKKTGSIRTAPFSVPPGRCVVLPVLHGVSYGQTVEVHDAESNATIANLPMLDGETVWTRWRIPIPDGTKSLIITASDEGRESFQWTALATPEVCQ